MTIRWRSFWGITSRVKNKNPAEEDAPESEKQKATGNERANQMVTFILIVHSYNYAIGVEESLKQIDGVESIKVDGNFIELEVMGKVDPSKIREMVEHETRKEVELIFPSAEMEEDRDKKKGTEGKLKKRIMPINQNDKTNEKIEEKIITLKINSSCDHCSKRVKKVLKTKGLEVVAMNREKDLIEVRGAVDIVELRSFIKDKLRKDVEVVNSTALMSSTESDNGATIQECKGEDGGGKKEKDGDATTKSSVVLKMTLHCKGCSDKIQKRIKKIKGVEKVLVNVDDDLIHVDGTMNVKEMISYLKRKSRRVVVVSINK